MIFDTHAHYDDPAFDEDRERLLSSMADNGVDTIVNIGASVETSIKSVELAYKYPFIYAAVGIHPEEVDQLNPESEAEICRLIEEEEAKDDKRILAVGEIGLDYHWASDGETRALQRESFKRQLDIAEKYKLPVMIHSRDAAEDTFEILRDAAGRGLICDIHCYSGSPEMAADYCKMGFYIGVGGVVTFKNGKKLKETVRRIPLSRILLETDCPYLSPEPHRGERNDSTRLKFVVAEIARLLEISEDEVIKTTSENARRFYRM